MTVKVKSEPPARPTHLSPTGGTTICSVRGNIISCTIKLVRRFSDCVVLYRFPDIDRTLVCITLVIKVEAQNISVDRVVIHLCDSCSLFAILLFLMFLGIA